MAYDFIVRVPQKPSDDEKAIIDLWNLFTKADEEERKKIYSQLTEQQKKSLNDHAQKVQETIKELKETIDKTLSVVDYSELAKTFTSIVSRLIESLSISPSSDYSIDNFLKDHDKIIHEIKNENSLKELEKTEVIEKLEVLKSILPEKYYITNNKLSNELTKDFLNKGEISLSVIKPNKKSEVLTYNSLTYDNNISITGRQEFTAYDRTIHNAVCTLYAADNKIITPAMVYRAANGMTNTEKVSSESEETVTRSLDKSRFLRLKVDYRDEAKARGIKDVKKFEIDSYLFPASVVTVEAGGHEVRAYKILETPALYKYAQLTKQIISIPVSLLDTREAARNTEEMIPIKEYLLRRIEIMKHDKATSSKILYDTIFEEVGITIKTLIQKKRYRDYITAVLSLWKTRDNYIKNFKEYKKGKIFKGIEIIH